jgi:D-amino-acid dehydrogenase
MNSSKAIVVGGGIIGTACAWYLSRSGWRVTIVEKGAFGQGCSHGNCGFICPSHVLPLAGPGAVGMALRSLFRKDSPFYIKPRFDPALWRWLAHFARRCNHADMLRSGRAIQALLNSARSLYDELIRDESLDCEWQARGMLFIFRTPARMEHHAETVAMLQEKFGLAARRLDGSALIELEPALKPGLAGAWHFPSDAHLRPDKLLSSWRKALESRGVTIRENCEVRGFLRDGKLARGLETSQGNMPAEAIVVAAGAWTPFLSRHLGCRVPIQPGKGYSITMARPRRCPTYPLIFEEDRVAVTPMATGYRLGSTMEFAGYDATLNRRRLDILRRAAPLYLHEPFGEPIEEEWFGWRPMTWDSLPIIDHSPPMENVLIAAGHNMLGVATAPATGKLVAELLGRQTPHLDPEPYRLRRFSGSG